MQAGDTVELYLNSTASTRGTVLEVRPDGKLVIDIHSKKGSRTVVRSPVLVKLVKKC